MVHLERSGQCHHDTDLTCAHSTATLKILSPVQATHRRHRLADAHNSSRARKDNCVQGKPLILRQHPPWLPCDVGVVAFKTAGLCDGDAGICRSCEQQRKAAVVLSYGLTYSDIQRTVLPCSVHHNRG